jgi:ribosomal protein S18 acetylase RimI-like enzyme
MTLRQATSDDEALVRSVLNRFKDYEDVEPSRFLSDPNTFLFVAEENGEAVGWIYAYELVRPEGRSTMLIYEVEVTDAAQRQGHGRALIAAVLSEARERGHTAMWVLTDDDNDAAKALYRATGGEGPRHQSLFTWKL